MASIIENLEIQQAQQFGALTVPEGCEPIREEEFERLPDYAVDLIFQSTRGELEPTSRDQLAEIMTQYFTVQNSTSLESNENVELAEQNQNEQGGDNHFDTRREVHSSQ
jgi:hypothetical protein